MTKPDLTELLREECAHHTQAKVAKMLGYSTCAISQVLSSTYAGDTGTILEQVERVFVNGQTTVACPILGEITPGVCSEHRRRKPTTDSFYARMYRECKACSRPNGAKGGGK